MVISTTEMSIITFKAKPNVIINIQSQSDGTKQLHFQNILTGKDPDALFISGLSDDQLRTLIVLCESELEKHPAMEEVEEITLMVPGVESRPSNKAIDQPSFIKAASLSDQLKIIAGNGGDKGVKMKPRYTMVNCEFCDKQIVITSPPSDEQYENAQIEIQDGTILLPDYVAATNPNGGHASYISGVYCNLTCFVRKINQILQR